MEGDAGLVGYLIDRLATKLPHRLGIITGTRLHDDEVLRTTRATLVKLSRTNVEVVLESLLDLLEDISQSYTSIHQHPAHLLQSEAYILELAATCCSVRKESFATENEQEETATSTDDLLRESLVNRVFERLQTLLDPLPEDYVLSAQTLLDNDSAPEPYLNSPPYGGGIGPISDIISYATYNGEIQKHVKVIVGFVTAFGWKAAFTYMRNVIHNIRTVGTDASTNTSKPAGVFEKESLVMLRLLSYYWVDGSKLGFIIQDICSSYLHFRKPYQNSVAIAIPVLITRWIERFPNEFVELHLLHKRLDGGADTLFDMILTATDNGRRKAPLYPLQTTLLFLMPDVFEVASNLREAKGNSVVKKVSFLDALRKALRNGNEQAGYCLVSLLRAARHFDIENDSALVSYALDVQDEVRDAIFRSSSANTSSSLFDQNMTTATLVSLAHLNLSVCLDSVVEDCISDNAPERFKIAIVQACCYFAKRPSASSYRELFDQALPLMKLHMQNRIDFVEDQTKDEAPSAILTCTILEFLGICLTPIMHEISDEASDTCFIKALVYCAVVAESSIRQQAVSVVEKLLARFKQVRPWLEGTNSGTVKNLPAYIWRHSSKVIVSLCQRILDEESHSLLTELHGYLRDCLFLMKKLPSLCAIPKDVHQVPAASAKLEATLLVSLCSADIEFCQVVTSCIRLMLEQCELVDENTESTRPSVSILRNGDIFREISSPTFRVTGLVAFQKRIRGLLRGLEFPSLGILNAWEIAFDRWIHLAKEVSIMPVDAIDELLLSEWRNLAGFLASAGGRCVSNQSIILEEPALAGLLWIDQPSSEHQEEALLNRYFRLGVQLLACANVRVRETMRDIFSHEVCSALHQPLFKAVEAEVEVLLTGALAQTDKAQDNEVIFAEQTVSLLKDLVERLQNPSDSTAASSVHLGALSLSFAKFMDGTSDNPSTLKVKIRICQLSEMITKRKEHLNLRDDVRIRNQLLEHIFGWIHRPSSSQADQSGSKSSRKDDMWRIQRDLDKACLKSLADLTFRLPLQPLDSQTDADLNGMKSQMFHTYFNRFLSLINHETYDSSTHEYGQNIYNPDDLPTNSELAIVILSNLLSANIDVGLKHSLSIGYHENMEIRCAFVKVLHNILSQGTEFRNLSDTAVTERYDELLNLLTKDMSLAVAMCSICPIAEVDEMAVCLLTVFEQRGKVFDLFEALIREEIEKTEHETEILRRTSVVTKMLSLYAKWKGHTYLRNTLQKVLDRLIQTSQDLDLELDPLRVNSAEELQKNAAQLQIVVKVFMDDICASASDIPISLRKVCNTIYEVVLPRFPNAKYTAVGAFIFLRFFCPAIVAPETEGLIASAPPKEMRRGLLLIAKVIQNLANNVLFGTKEPYMFPLNHFLVENIQFVTSFLRDISTPPENLEVSSIKDAYDFGSCVSFHRFLYDHWDHLRQILVTQERRDYVRSPEMIVRGRSPVLEPLRGLVSNLGPPPLAISWNRPQIATNSPPLYARFQNFMLRNASRNTESFLTARAVYEGGETKDGLPFVCVILRYIEAEGIDFETLLYYYLKIASRLWHEPFAIFIDATCYSGKEEPRDDFFKMLDLLTPFELQQNLVRIFIYNMNSTFKRCLRRILRLATKNDNSILHPNNVEYLLLPSFENVQVYFNPSNVHLPKETVSIVTDTRFVFQNVTRLSKSKGKVNVLIKVGSQFVQITTVNGQEILPGAGLNTLINDIFRLSDIEEAPSAIQMEDEFSFGLKADGGKIVMCFTSTHKADILRSIRSLKTRHGKDGRLQKSFERLIRPQDVPGTLLNLAFTNMLSVDDRLRLSAYNLLVALCRAFKLQTTTRLISANDLSLPLDPSAFVVKISSQLAQSEPQLTVDFITEFFVSWESFAEDQKPLSLAYMAPWIFGLRMYVLANEMDGDKGREKVANILRKFIDLIALDPNMAYTLEKSVWPVLVQDETLVDIFIDELMKTALGYGAQSQVIETISSTVANMASVTIHARFLSRLRKALNRSSLRPTAQLPDNGVWPEICVMLRICVGLSFDSSIQSQLFLPEIFHIVTMLSNTGNHYVRLLVQKLLVNTVHAICASFDLDEASLSKLRTNLDLLSQSKSEVHLAANLLRDGSRVPISVENGPTLIATEHLVTILFDICEVAAISTDMANIWRSRWMSLVASTAFQNNPAIQPRAFAVMGYLAREEVDDDLLYQVLVALRNSISQFGDDGSSEMLISIITCVSRMMANLPSASRYGLQLFWLAMSLVRLVPEGLFNCTAHFLEAILINIGNVGGVRGNQTVSMLLQSRGQLNEAAQLLDDAYGIHFDEDNFHFAVCACLVRGLSSAATRVSAIRVLCTFLEITTSKGESPILPSRPQNDSPYLALILARCIGQDDFRDSMWLSGLNPDSISLVLGPSGRPSIEDMDDNDLLLVSAIELVDFQCLEDTIQAKTLLWLNELAMGRPSVFIRLCGAMPSILNDVLIHGQDSAALEAAHTLVRTLTSERRYSREMGSMASLTEILNDMGFSGLWRSSFQGLSDANRNDCVELTEKLIELIVI